METRLDRRLWLVTLATTVLLVGPIGSAMYKDAGQGAPG